ATAKEKKIETIFALVFDAATGKKIEHVAGKVIVGQPTHNVEVILTPNEKACNLFLISNLSTNNNKTIQSPTLTMTDFLKLTESTGSLDATALPMCSKEIKLQKIQSSEFVNRIVDLYFSYARIDISREAGAADFVLSGATTYSAPNGFVAQQVTLPMYNSGKIARTKTANQNMVTELYLFENNGVTNTVPQGSNPTEVIIRGTNTGFSEGYYKLVIKYPHNGRDCYDINRSVLYKIALTKITGPGYSSLEQALANPPSNIEYTITVGNGSDVTIGNGDYFLGLSNNSYEICATGALENLVATTVTYGKNPAAEAPSIDFNQLEKSVVASGLGLSVTQPVFKENSYLDIKISIASNFTTGAITIRIGKLQKTITITRKESIAHSSVVVNQFGLPQYTSVEFADSRVAWLQLGATSTEFTDNYKVRSTGNGIYIQLKENNDIKRRTSLFIYNSNMYSIHKVFIEQLALALPTQFIDINGIKWARGNLIANDANGCKIGAPTDGGLYFKFGSLIGYKGGTNTDGSGSASNKFSSDYTLAVKPTIYLENPTFEKAPFNFETSPIDKEYNLSMDKPTEGLGDPCRYYLGGKWRTPSAKQLSQIFDNQTGGSGTPTKSWRVIQESSISYLQSMINSEYKVPASGYRAPTGAITSDKTDGYYLSSSINSDSDYDRFCYTLRFYNGYINPYTEDTSLPDAQHKDHYVKRNSGYPVRCVWDDAPRFSLSTIPYWLNVNGKQTIQTITVKVDNADVSSWTATASGDGLEVSTNNTTYSKTVIGVPGRTLYIRYSNFINPSTLKRTGNVTITSNGVKTIIIATSQYSTPQAN
ncbi:MAG: fimbrial protein, partial [Marinifilaceae bacterium]